MASGYPPCATPEEIEEFIRYKSVGFKTLNENIDFTLRGDKAVRYYEIFVKSSPLRSGYFTDAGHRLRYNQFLRTDFWWTTARRTDEFFDYVFYNSDTYEVPTTKTEIAELYFRLDQSQVTHTRKVFSFMDFVASMGGINRILLQIAGFFYGGFAAFWSAFSILGLFYKIRSDKNIFE
jgi:hypothetical protein